MSEREARERGIAREQRADERVELRDIARDEAVVTDQQKIVRAAIFIAVEQHGLIDAEQLDRHTSNVFLLVLLSAAIGVRETHVRLISPRLLEEPHLKPRVQPR